MAVPLIWLEIGKYENIYQDQYLGYRRDRIRNTSPYKAGDNLCLLVHVEMPPGETLGTSTLTGKIYTTDEHFSVNYSESSMDPSWNWCWFWATPTWFIRAAKYGARDRAVHVYNNEVWNGWRSKNPVRFHVTVPITTGNLKSINTPYYTTWEGRRYAVITCVAENLTEGARYWADAFCYPSNVFLAKAEVGAGVGTERTCWIWIEESIINAKCAAEPFRFKVDLIDATDKVLDSLIYPECYPEGKQEIVEYCPDEVTPKRWRECINGKWVWKSQTCPECYPEGKHETLELCPDGVTEKRQQTCIAGNWIEDYRECPEAPAAHDTALSIAITDEAGNPITESVVGETVYIAGQLKDIVDNIALEGALIILYKNGVATANTDITEDASGIYSIPYTITKADVGIVKFKTYFAGT